MTEEAASDSNRKAYGPNKWVDIYSQATTWQEQAAVTLAPFAGLTSNALAHLRSEWITWEDEFVTIRVPPTADCNQLKILRGGERSIPVSRNQPCNYCRNEGDSEKFENLWVGSRRREPRRYTTTLHRELAEPAVEFLIKVFKKWGRSELAATPNGIQVAANRLVDENTDTQSYSKLLRTGVVLYCHYGLTQAEITDVTPYSQRQIRHIEYATPEISRDQNNSHLYLKAVAANEPVGIPALEKEFDVTQKSIYDALSRLEEAGRLEVEKRPSRQPHMWSTVGDWQSPFQCDVCGYESATLRGVRSHKRQAHD